MQTHNKISLIAFIKSVSVTHVLTWLEWSVDQAGRSLRVEQAIARTASVILYCFPIGQTKQRNFW